MFVWHENHLLFLSGLGQLIKRPVLAPTYVQLSVKKTKDMQRAYRHKTRFPSNQQKHACTVANSFALQTPPVTSEKHIVECSALQYHTAHEALLLLQYLDVQQIQQELTVSDDTNLTIASIEAITVNIALVVYRSVPTACPKSRPRAIQSREKTPMKHVYLLYVRQ